MEIAMAILYRVARLVLWAASRVHFRRIEVRNRERVPRRGPLLVVANHPASFTDVVVLASAVPRQLHFLAMAPIFKPWIRGAALRLGGTLPIYRRVDDPAQVHRNEDTFRAVHAILERGGAVLIFPEGTSETDRSLVRVKTGAARIALAHSGADTLALLPIGLHFAQRTGFWTDVVVSVGGRIALEPFLASSSVDPAAAVRELTDCIQHTLEKLILHVGESERRAIVEGIEQLYADEAHAASSGAHDLARLRGMAECVEYYARTDPERMARGWRRIERYRKRLEILGVHDRAIREMLPRHGRTRERLRLVLLGLLGIVPAAIGGMAHYLPYRLSGSLGARLNSDPTRVAAYRIAVGLVVFPASYAALALGLHGGLHWSIRLTTMTLVLLVPMGVHAILYFNWLAHQRERMRLIALRIAHRRRIAQLRRERRELIRLFEEAWKEFRAVHGEPALP